MAFYRDQQPVWFCGVRSQGLAALLHRIALRLLSEGVLEHLPTRILLDALPSEVAATCQSSLATLFPSSIITRSEIGTAALPPILPSAPFDLPPTEAREERRRLLQRQKLFSFAIAGAILYLLLLLWGAGDLFIRQNALQNIRREIAKVEQPAQDAQQQSSRWKTLRPLIDPTTYALDLLSAAATPTAGGKVRLTLFALEQGHLHIAGEAADLTQANSAIEQLKKSPLLQQFDWNNAQPQLAGKNSVKFDIEGTHPDAAPQNSEEAQPTP
jgi:Tfp pilus assembly protein PilN